MVTVHMHCELVEPDVDSVAIIYNLYKPKAIEPPWAISNVIADLFNEKIDGTTVAPARIYSW